MPPPFALNFTDYMKAMMPQEFGGKQVPRIEDYTDLPDPFYNALPEDKKEAYKDSKLEKVAKDINDTAAQAVADAENTDFYKNELTPDIQKITKEKTNYLAIQETLNKMRERDIKGLGTKDIKALKEPRYPQNKVYSTAYVEGLKIHEDKINNRIQELDDIIATKTVKKQTKAETERITKAETERITKNNDLLKIVDLFNKLKEEKKRIKKLLK